MIRFILTVALLSPACSAPPTDPAADIAASAAGCLRSAQRCRLGGGALGVCEKRPSPIDGVAFACTPQH